MTRERMTIIKLELTDAIYCRTKGQQNIYMAALLLSNSLNCLVHSQKGRESLGGQLQGLCGDMNGERLFEFRGPRRCVLSSGSLMTAQYQTSDRPHCSIRFHPSISHDGSSSSSGGIQQNKMESSLASSSHAGRLPDDNLNNCPRQEGSPTVIQMPISATGHPNDDL